MASSVPSTTSPSAINQGLQPLGLGTNGNREVYDLFGSLLAGGYSEPSNGRRTEHPVLKDIIMENGKIREEEIYHVFVNGLQKNVELSDLYKWQVHELFPLVEDQLRRIQTSLIFDAAMLDPVPPEGVVRLISSTEQKKTRGSERKGLGLMLENDHLNSPEGIPFFFASLKTIIQAVLNSLATDVIREVMLCKKVEEMERSRYTTFPINYTKLLQEEISRYGAISHGSMRLLSLIEEAKKNMRTVPDTLLCPSGGTLFLSYISTPHSNAYRNIAESINPKHELMSPIPTSYPTGKAITTTLGLAVFENEVTMPAPNPSTGVATNYQLMNRQTAVGEFYPMTGTHTTREGLVDFTSSSRDIAIYNENSDGFEIIRLVDAINKSRVFTDDGYESFVFDLCDHYNDKQEVKFFKNTTVRSLENIEECDMIPDIEDRPFMLATQDRGGVWKPARYFGELGSYAITQQSIKATSTTVMNSFNIPIDFMNQHLASLKYYIKRLDEAPLTAARLKDLLAVYVPNSLADIEAADKVTFSPTLSFALVKEPPIFFNTITAFDFYISHRLEFEELFKGTAGDPNVNPQIPPYTVHNLWKTLHDNVENWKTCFYQLSNCISNVLPESELISKESTPVYSEMDMINSLFYNSILGHRAPIYCRGNSTTASLISWTAAGVAKSSATVTGLTGKEPFIALQDALDDAGLLDSTFKGVSKLCLAILSSSNPSKALYGISLLLTKKDPTSKEILKNLKNELLEDNPTFDTVSLLASQSDDIIGQPAPGTQYSITDVDIKEANAAKSGQLYISELLLSDAIAKVIGNMSNADAFGIGDPTTRFKSPITFTDVNTDRFKPHRVNIQSGIHPFSKFTEVLSEVKKTGSMKIGKRANPGLFDSYGPVSNKKRIKVSDSKSVFLSSERASVDNEMFDWRWRQSFNLSNHVLSVCMQAVLTTAINKRTFTFMEDNDIYIPFGACVWRMSINHDMGTFTVMKRGPETGKTIFSHAHWGWGYNNAVKNYLGALTLFTAVDVLKPENITHLHDIWFQGYGGGHNSKWITSVNDLREYGLDRPSMIATLVPLHEKMDRPIAFTGMPPPELNLNLDSGRDFMWSGAQFYDRVFKISDLVNESRPVSNSNFYEMSDRFNDIALPGFHIKYNSNTKLFDIVVESKGHLKQGGVYPGAAPVMNGKDCYFQPLPIASYRVC